MSTPDAEDTGYREQPFGLPPNQRRKSGQTYWERLPRYAENADLSAGHANGGARTWARSAYFNEQAAANALRNGDHDAAALYTEMAEAGRDAAEALRDMAKAARSVAAHFRRPLT